VGELNHEEPTRERVSRMAQRKRQYGSGCLLKRGRGWAIRWRAIEIAPDGTTRRVLQYETLGEVSRREAAETLQQRLAASGKGPRRSNVLFSALVSNWKATVLPMYRFSTQKNHQHIATKHLVPRFGETPISDVTRQAIQAYVAHLTQAGYAPKTIDHIHDVLSAILRTAVKWGHLEDNPARNVDLPALRTVRPKWALTTKQAGDLLDALPPLARTMVGLAILSGLRRGELFALRWKHLNLESRCLTVCESVYEGQFGAPKTEAGIRRIPLAANLVALMTEWKQRAKHTEPDGLVFSTWSGKPISPNNVLRQWVVPAAASLELPKISWLTFRRTYSSWAHESGVPGKVIAALMGHAKVDTTLNVYVQVLDDSLRAAAEKVGRELFTIVHKPEEPTALTH
jgi:integrase